MLPDDDLRGLVQVARAGVIAKPDHWCSTVVLRRGRQARTSGKVFHETAEIGNHRLHRVCCSMISETQTR